MINYARCYDTHPALKVGEFEIYGGSASGPKVLDADIYVSLQTGSNSGFKSDPWDSKQVIEVHYPITDGCAPNNVPRFKKLIEWLCNQLQAGKKIHIGCIGGHGRTGMVLAAVVATLTSEKDAINYVRDNYCKKVVESESQVNFLVKHYGAKAVTPSKAGVSFSDSWSNGTSPSKSAYPEEYYSSYASVERFDSAPSKPVRVVGKGIMTLRPVPSHRCLWSAPKEKN